MFKLNNHGWSVENMVGLLCVLIFFIILVGLMSYFGGVDKDSPHPLYSTSQEND